KSYTNRLTQIQGYPNSGTDYQTKGPTHNVVLSTSLHLLVGRNLRDGHSRRNRYRMTDQDDGYGPQKSYLSYRKTKTEEHNRPQYRRYRREKYRRRPKLGFSRFQ